MLNISQTNIDDSVVLTTKHFNLLITSKEKGEIGVVAKILTAIIQRNWSEEGFRTLCKQHLFSEWKRSDQQNEFENFEDYLRSHGINY